MLQPCALVVGEANRVVLERTPVCCISRKQHVVTRRIRPNTRFTQGCRGPAAQVRRRQDDTHLLKSRVTRRNHLLIKTSVQVDLRVATAHRKDPRCTSKSWQHLHTTKVRSRQLQLEQANLQPVGPRPFAGVERPLTTRVPRCSNSSGGGQQHPQSTHRNVL